MAEQTARVEPDPGAWATTGRTSDLALLVLRSRRRDPCAERVAIELEWRRSPAELAAISERQAETRVNSNPASRYLKSIINRHPARRSHCPP